MSKIKKLIKFVKSVWHEGKGYNSIDNCPITVFDEVCSTSNVSLLGWGEKNENWKAWALTEFQKITRCLLNFG
jgi:hypothetical protein